VSELVLFPDQTSHFIFGAEPFCQSGIGRPSSADTLMDFTKRDVVAMARKRKSRYTTPATLRTAPLVANASHVANSSLRELKMGEEAVAVAFFGRYA